MMKQIVPALFFLVILGFIPACAYPWSPSPIQIKIMSDCGSSGGDSNCSVTLFNEARSPRAFNWKATIQPSSVQLDVTSGTVTPGGSSEIQFHISREQCPFNMTFTGSDGTVVKTGNIQC